MAPSWWDAGGRPERRDAPALRRWGKTRRGELADAGGAGTAAGTHGVVAQRRSRLLAPLSHELGGVVAEQEAARAARRRARHRSGVDRLGVVVATRALL